VTEVYTGSSAESAGIQRGDLITAIDERDIISRGTEFALQRLEGEERTAVSVTFQRQGEVFTETLIRQAISVTTVEADVVDGIGFMRITAFNALTTTQFDAALRTFSEAGVRALLIDVRNTGSGAHSEVAGMVNSLIGAGTVARTEHRGGIVRDFIVTDNSRAFPVSMQNIPIVVLVNTGTSGAGELLAAILQNYAPTAQIVGTRTEGNAYLQQIHSLRDDSAIRITVARIFLANGQDFRGSGVNPDFIVDMDTEVSYNIGELRDRQSSEIADLQIRRAFDIINTA
jgi:carboxyl-terminal processing protease